MKNQTEIKEAMQELANLISESVCWEEKAVYVAQRIGLQGEKRRNRYESKVNSDLLKHIHCFAFDFFGWELSSDNSDIVVSASDFQSYFSMYHKKLETMYMGMHELANKLVSLGMQPFARCLYSRLACIEKDIIYCNRTVAEGVKCNWKPEWVFLHQTTDYNVHDKYEKKEEKEGWEY